MALLKPQFIALHLQEVGGKTYEKSMEYVQEFIKQLCESPELETYSRIRIYLDEDYTSAEHFTVNIWSVFPSNLWFFCLVVVGLVFDRRVYCVLRLVSVHFFARALARCRFALLCFVVGFSCFQFALFSSAVRKQSAENEVIVPDIGTQMHTHTHTLVIAHAYTTAPIGVRVDDVFVYIALPE